MAGEWYLERWRDGGRREEVLPRRHDGLHGEVLQGGTSVIFVFPTDYDGFGHFCAITVVVFLLFFAIALHAGGIQDPLVDVGVVPHESCL